MELRTYYDFALDDYRFLCELKKQIINKEVNFIINPSLYLSIICLDKALNHYFLRTALKMMRMAAKSTPATGQIIHALETPVKFMIKNAAVATSQ